MMHCIYVHSSDPLTTKLQPERLVSVVYIQLILFRITPEQLRLCDDIVPVIDKLIILFLVFLLMILSLFFLEVLCTTTTDAITHLVIIVCSGFLLWTLYLSCTSRSHEVLVGLSSTVLRVVTLVLYGGGTSDGAELVVVVVRVSLVIRLVICMHRLSLVARLQMLRLIRRGIETQF